MTYNDAWKNSGGSRLAIGSLFDGSGTVPLAATMCGIEPVWCSEVEPFCIAVTRARFPKMKHYGNICDIKGDKIEPVDIICGGSPCQDLSVAGKRAGLDGGERSVLFHEQIRIIKEMRNATNNIRPRFAVWENVPGAFSSNGGEDFRCVLEAFCHIADESADIPRPKKWTAAGCIVGDGWSVAYRTLDAQYWGVAQRRRRIFLVADFRSERAGEILFKSEGVPRNFTPSGETGQGTAGNAETGPGTSGGNVMSVTEDMTATLRAEEHGHQPCVMQASGFCTEHSAKSRSVDYEEERSPTLRAGVVPATVYENHSQDTRFRETGDVAPTVSSTYGTGGNNQPFVVGTPKTLKIRSGCEGGGKGALIQDDKSATLGCNNGQILFVPKAWDGSDVSPTLTANNAGGNQRMPDKDNFNCVVEAYGICSEEEQQPTLTAKGPGAVAQPASFSSHPDYIVRRLTPTESARLQGFPDYWCSDLGIENPTEDEITFWTEVWETHRKINGVSKKPKSRKQIIKWLQNPHSDAAEYKMWGNGMALPCVLYIMQGLREAGEPAGVLQA